MLSAQAVTLQLASVRHSELQTVNWKYGYITRTKQAGSFFVLDGKIIKQTCL